MSVYDINGNTVSGAMSISLPNVVFLGDSICTYPSSPAFGGWIYDMVDYASFGSLKTYGKGGARWNVSASTGDDDTMYDQFLTLKSEVDNGRVEPDVIVINAGINDVAYNTSIGSADTAFNGSDVLTKSRSQITTLYESIRYTCESILAEYTYAQLILVTPYQSGMLARETGVRNVRDCIIESAKRLSAKVINQTDDLGVYNYNESVTPLYLNSDGTHPSSDGKKLLTRFFVKELERLVLPADVQ